MAIGFIVTKAKKATASHAKTLSALLLYVCGPAMILSAFEAVEYSLDNLKQMGIFFLASFTASLQAADAGTESIYFN